MEWAKSMDDIFICIEWEEYIFTAVYGKHVLWHKLHKDSQEQNPMELSLK